MVCITIIKGRWKGRVRYFSGVRVIKAFMPFKLGEEVDPTEIFFGLVSHRNDWQVDYNRATSEELLVWFRAEIVARIMRALDEGRSVRFMSNEWSWQADGPNLLNLAQEIEDTIVNSGFNICLESDDENGVVIGTQGLE
ncbi:hypothetical protein COX67_01845 [Candidatus Falkowbacteria bacterium CG_4_10_14_0_2_um_filter_36_22]|nr:MAG: hypothetical protein COX67_01845 [Candidatus Falkowbacteria bacterium CG_4_10_14_0_2_um_filter_36_22]